MICVGLTGGIGSGKSYVADIFSHLGIPVYDADSKAREISSGSQDVKEKIKALFGEEAYEEGSLNSKMIGKLVFNDQAMLDKLNKIIHPEVKRDFRQWCKTRGSSPYIIKEAAILFETGSYRKLNYTILVLAPVKTRIERVKLRSGLDDDQVRKRMESQWKDEDKLKLADFVIRNDGNSMVLPQVINIHREILKKTDGKIC